MHYAPIKCAFSWTLISFLALYSIHTIQFLNQWAHINSQFPSTNLYISLSLQVSFFFLQKISLDS